MPKFLKEENAKDVPYRALILSSVMVQIFLIMSYYSSSVFVLALEMTSAMTLIPHFFVAAYGLKLILKNDLEANEKNTVKKIGSLPL